MNVKMHCGDLNIFTSISAEYTYYVRATTLVGGTEKTVSSERITVQVPSSGELCNQANSMWVERKGVRVSN